MARVDELHALYLAKLGIELQRGTVDELQLLARLHDFKAVCLAMHIAGNESAGGFHLGDAETGSVHVDGIVHHGLVGGTLHADMAAAVGEVRGVCCGGVHAALGADAAAAADGDILAALGNERHALAIVENHVLQRGVLGAVEQHAGVRAVVAAQHERITNGKTFVAGIFCKTHAVAGELFCSGIPAHITGFAGGHHAAICLEGKNALHLVPAAVISEKKLTSFHGVSAGRAELQGGFAILDFNNVAFGGERLCRVDADIGDCHVLTIHQHKRKHLAVKDEFCLLSAKFQIF